MHYFLFSRKGAAIACIILFHCCLPENNLNFRQNCNNANSPASGGCHLHFKVFTCLSKHLPFHPRFCLTKHINEQGTVNAVFSASQIEIWETAFQNCSHTYPIDKDMPLTFWLMWPSLFLFLWWFFSTELLLLRYRTVPSVIWQNISDLWNNSIAWNNFRPW